MLVPEIVAFCQSRVGEDPFPTDVSVNAEQLSHHIHMDFCRTLCLVQSKPSCEGTVEKNHLHLDTDTKPKQPFQ